MRATVKRAIPVDPPIESVTLEMSAEEAWALRVFLGSVTKGMLADANAEALPGLLDNVPGGVLTDVNATSPAWRALVKVLG
jgi:hypothetical protein